MDSIVAVDIETTGLDPDRDAITEIGAVKFNGSRIEAEWSSLVNPGRHIPEFITGMTGIDDAMVRHAPGFGEIAADVQAFIGDSAVLGHSVRFDLGFLQKKVSFRGNKVVDTYELASVLIPNAGRYNLGSLCKELGVLLPATHRALDDARATHGIYVRLESLAEELPSDLLQELLRCSEQVDWDARPVFDEILRARGVKRVKATRPAKKAAPIADGAGQPALETPEHPLSLDEEEVASILEHAGAFSKHFAAYEQRPEQIHMLRAVTSALSRGRHLMVEAGTGIGKSFAYLIPAALFAVRNNTRVVVSTNTINLQDQLVRKDIPDLEEALRLGTRASVLKGRSNYLCPRRLENLERFGPRNADEMRVLAKVLIWRQTDSSGDRSTINLNGIAERDVWMRLSAEDDACTTETCIKRTGGACPFHRARIAAQSAHLLVVNHALLLSDVAAEGKVLPEYSYLIVDEGHHLESATTNALSFRLRQFDLERLLKELGGSGGGLLGNLLAACRSSFSPADFGSIQQRVNHATDAAFRIQELVREFFKSMSDFLADSTEAGTPSVYATQTRILPATRTQPGWEAVEIAWDALEQTLGSLMKSLSGIHDSATGLPENGAEAVQDALSDLNSVYRRLAEAESNVSAMIGKPSPDQVYWLEARPNGANLSLNTAPLRVGPLIEKVLWHEKSSVILTSATLTAHGEFDYLRNTLGADEADEIQLGSPFDYESSTLLYVANDMPEPNSHSYQQALNQALVSTARATGGRVLALFTSYAAIKRTAQAITQPLSRDDILVYEHGDGASPNMLLESFKSSERAVLLGTRSFWEGVDIPGAALSVLFIAKLPFDVPTDPLIAARSELYEDPFLEYYLPEAVLKFRQGFGRLIRTASDKGVVAIMDRRVISKQYGRLFLESLPRCTSRQGATANLAREAARWLGT